MFFAEDYAAYQTVTDCRWEKQDQYDHSGLDSEMNADHMIYTCKYSGLKSESDYNEGNLIG